MLKFYCCSIPVIHLEFFQDLQGRALFVPVWLLPPEGGHALGTDSGSTGTSALYF